MSQWNAGRVIGYSIIAAGLVAIGHCYTRDCLHDDARVTKKPQTSIHVDGDYIQADNVTINIQNNIKDSYQNNIKDSYNKPKNSGNSHIGSRSNSGSNSDIGKLVRIEELRREKESKETPQEDTQTKTIIYFVPNNNATENNSGKRRSNSKNNNANDQCYCVYQNPHNPDLIIIEAGITADHRGNEEINIIENHNGRVRQKPINPNIDNIHNWNRLEMMSAQGFLGYFGRYYAFDGIMNDSWRATNSWFNNLSGNVPRSGSYFPYGSDKHN